MGKPAQRESTYEELLRVPEHLVAEILNGKLHTHPRPAPRHAVSAAAIGGELYGPFHKGSGGPGGWWILTEPELHLARQVMVPNLAGWLRERMPEIPDLAWFELTPDWVCEILSPATAQTDRSIKMLLYAEHGVGHLWLVDPALHTLEAYELGNAGWTLVATLKEDDTVSLPPFAEIGFPLSALWA